MHDTFFLAKFFINKIFPLITNNLHTQPRETRAQIYLFYTVDHLSIYKLFFAKLNDLYDIASLVTSVSHDLRLSFTKTHRTVFLHNDVTRFHVAFMSFSYAAKCNFIRWYAAALTSSITTKDAMLKTTLPFVTSVGWEYDLILL